MVVGFNHNFRYKGVLYHVQTEDGGIKNPVIMTHLFTGGTILSSSKTSYADILKSDRLESVVEELMKEQHREMLRRLRDGELDETISARLAAASLSAAVGKAANGDPAAAVERPSATVASPPAPKEPPGQRTSSDGAASRAPATAAPVARPVVAAAPAAEANPAPPRAAVVTAKPGAKPIPETTTEPARENTLDEIILSYLLGEGGKKP